MSNTPNQNGYKWLKYIGHPSVRYAPIGDKHLKIRTKQLLCAVGCIENITISCKYIFINTLFFTFKIPHTEQTYNDLQNIMQTYERSR